MSRIWLAFLVIFLAVGCAAMGNSAPKGEAPRMTKEVLQPLLGSPDLILIDVRQGKDLANSDQKIAGAIRQDPKDFDSWRDKYPKAKTLVLYCA